MADFNLNFLNDIASTGSQSVPIIEYLVNTKFHKGPGAITNLKSIYSTQETNTIVEVF